jgi:hypothetical protein
LFVCPPCNRVRSHTALPELLPLALRRQQLKTINAAGEEVRSKNEQLLFGGRLAAIRTMIPGHQSVSVPRIQTPFAIEPREKSVAALEDIKELGITGE